jgi:hypothetical protein
MNTRLQTAVVALALLNAFQASALVTITQHPTDQVVSLNAHVTNSVTASSTAPPITYQWYGKGALLPDQNQPHVGPTKRHARPGRRILRHRQRRR